MKKPLDNYSFIGSFLEKCGENVVFLCGDVSREFCEKLSNVAESMNRNIRVFEIIKEQHRRRIGEAAERQGISKIFGFMARSQTMLKFLLLFVQSKVDKEVIESVKKCDAVVWVGLHEDFDVFYLVDRRLVNAVKEKNCLFLSFPSKTIADMLGMKYEDYWQIFFEALNYPWEKMKVLGEELRNCLINSNTLNITSPLGSDFTIKPKGEDVHLSYGINKKALSKGRIQLQLPAGELFMELKEPEVNGKMFFDIPCILNKQVVSNVKITVENGNVVDFQSEKGEGVLQRFFERKESRIVGELGFGLNPAIKPCGSIYVDEKAYKTIHVGFGKMRMLNHIDLVMSNPTVQANGKLIII